MSPTKGKLHKWLSEQGAIGALAFAPQGDLLVTAGRDLRFWRTKKRQLLLTLDQRSAPIRDVRFSADGQLLLAAGEDQRALLWNLDDLSRAPTGLGFDQDDIPAVSGRTSGAP